MATVNISFTIPVDKEDEFEAVLRDKFDFDANNPMTNGQLVAALRAEVINRLKRDYRKYQERHTVVYDDLSAE